MSTPGSDIPRSLNAVGGAARDQVSGGQDETAEVISFADRTGLAVDLSRERLLALAVEATDLGLWHLDLEADRMAGTPRCRELIGLPHVAVPLTFGDWQERLHDEDRAENERRVRAACSGESDGRYAHEFRVVLAGSAVRWIAATGRREDLASGCRLVGTFRDITDERLAAERLSASERRFRVLADTMPQMVWSTRADGFHDYYNKRWYEFTGVPEGSTDGEGWNGMFHPDDQARARERWHHSLATGEPYEIEYRLRRHDGQYRWTLGRALPIRNGAGRIERWFGTCTDIHDLKEAKEAHELISRELNHRIKNIFALVLGLVSLSARSRSDAGPFADDLKQRLSALIKAHEYVRPQAAAHSADRPRTLQGLLVALLEPYDSERQGRILIEGADAAIGTSAATALALAFHELATNALKYGALSMAGGRVRVACDVGAQDVVVTWSERGGPAIEGVPGRKGFGTLLAERSVTGQLGGSVALDWDPAGLTLVMSLPKERLAQ